MTQYSIAYVSHQFSMSFKTGKKKKKLNNGIAEPKSRYLV